MLFAQILCPIAVREMNTTAVWLDQSERGQHRDQGGDDWTVYN